MFSRGNPEKVKNVIPAPITGILISTENDLAHFGNFKIVQKSA
jgi:hypothetical protein